MDSASPSRTSAFGEQKVDYVIRQGVCLAAFLIHLTLFWGDWHSPIWIFAVFQGFIYPAVLQFTPYFHRSASDDLLIDSAMYGLCLGLWGFNVYLIGTFFASANIINLATGGLKSCLRGALLMLTGALLSGALMDFVYRPQLPFTTMLITSLGLIFFLTSVGVRIHKINTRLRSIRSDLQAEREELLNLNALALAVNSHLDVDVIMRSMMSNMERIYPFESLYILGLEEDSKHLIVSGVYGSGISADEQRAFRKFRFSLEHDQNSLFIRGLRRGKATCVANLSKEMITRSARIDQELFAIKPSVSLAYFPVFVNDVVIAGACFINYEKPFELSRREIGRIQQYLVQVGTAVRNATLFQELSHAKSEAEIAQKKAELSEETKSRFLANMSHEIRTPLTAIMGYTEALQEDTISREEQRNFLGYILRSSKHLLTMINDILDISKIEANKIQIERMECSLLDVLCDIDSYMQIKAKEKQLNYQLIIHFPIPKIINTDPTRLRQILLNLCNNAVKFTQQGHIHLEISALDSGMLQFGVNDSGIGIDESKQEKVFNAFDQADTSTTRLFGGTGLGLYISRNLAQLLGGDIHLHSKSGVGTTFYLTIPMDEDQPCSIESETHFSRAMAEVYESKTYRGIPRLQGRVLIAEDNLENQHLIKRLILQTGLEVDLVTDGQQAVAAAEKNAYVLILMDMQMPLMGGREAATLIKRSGNQTPIVAFTANVMKDQLQDYHQLGFVEVLEKPINRSKLFETLTHFAPKNTSEEKPIGNILVVEDDETTRMILQRHVNKCDATLKVFLAKDGSEAVELVKQNPIDLIFMDMEMPVMGGLEATQTIRALNFHMPIYIVSGNIAKEDVLRCEDIGANGHIAKPLNREQIKDVIERALHIQR